MTVQTDDMKAFDAALAKHALDKEKVLAYVGPDYEKTWGTLPSLLPEDEALWNKIPDAKKGRPAKRRPADERVTVGSLFSYLPRRNSQQAVPRLLLITGCAKRKIDGTKSDEPAYSVRYLTEIPRPEPLKRLVAERPVSHRMLLGSDDPVGARREYTPLWVAKPSDLAPAAITPHAPVAVPTPVAVASPPAPPTPTIVTGEGERLLSSIDEKLGSILSLYARDSALLANIAASVMILPDLIQMVKSMVGTLDGVVNQIEKTRATLCSLPRYGASGVSHKNLNNSGPRPAVDIPEPAGSP